MKSLIFSAVFVLIVAQLALAGAEVFAKEDNTLTYNEPSIKPDSVFWGLKNALDRLSLALTFSPESKAEKGLKIAEERFIEFRAMAEKGNVDAAKKARESHDEYIEKIKASAKNIRENNKTEEIRKQIKIEKEIHDYEERIENITSSIKVKIRTDDSLTDEQKALIESLIQSMRNETVSLKIEIEKNKEKIKIEIKQRGEKSEEEIEEEIEHIEQMYNLTTIKLKKAQEQIDEAKEEISKLMDEVSRHNLSDASVIVLMNSSFEKLDSAQKAFDSSKFGEAYGLANAAEQLAENAREKIEKLIENEEKQKYTYEDMYNDSALCNVDSDCNTEFSACSCSYTCRNKYHETLNDCARACTDSEIDINIKSCECEANTCVPKHELEEKKDKEDRTCIKVITPAKNEETGECKEFPTPCDVPRGWEHVGNCPDSTYRGVPAAPIVHNMTQPNGYKFCAVLLGDEWKSYYYLADCSKGYEDQTYNIKIYLGYKEYWRYSDNSSTIGVQPEIPDEFEAN